MSCRITWQFLDGSQPSKLIKNVCDVNKIIDQAGRGSWGVEEHLLKRSLFQIIYKDWRPHKGRVVYLPFSEVAFTLFFDQS